MVVEQLKLQSADKKEEAEASSLVLGYLIYLPLTSAINRQVNCTWCSSIRYTWH